MQRCLPCDGWKKGCKNTRILPGYFHSLRCPENAMTAITFNTANLTFRQLFGNGLGYRVPPFQRDYSWTEEEWDDLWQDILGLFSEDGEPSHYMGYLVLQSSDNKQFDIIDGQQRMTTLSVMILAVLRCLKDMIEAGADAENDSRREEQLRNSYIGYLDPVSLVARPKLKLNRNNDKFYRTYLVPLEPLPRRGLNLSEHQLRKAFNWFNERIRNSTSTIPARTGQELATFLEKLVDRLFFTVITVTDELNAFKVFETLNARGVRLSATDLLKNYLFSIIDNQNTHQSELDALEEQWERIIGLLGNSHFPEFLRVFWNSRNKLVRKSDLFKVIRRKIRTRADAFDLLRDLAHSAETYANMRDPQESVWNNVEKNALKQLSMFYVRQPFSMLLACHERFYEKERKTFSRIIQAVAVISFRYNVICNLQTNEQESLYNDIACKVSAGEYAKLSDVILALQKVYPNDEQFKPMFASKELRTTNNRNKKIMRYILFEIERHISGISFDIESATYSLEHILPERPSAAWSDIEESIQERLIYRIGNMTLLETAKNHGIGNEGYSVKQGAYSASQVQITHAITEHYESWDEQKIESRQKQLAKHAAAIWKIDI